MFTLLLVLLAVRPFITALAFRTLDLSYSVAVICIAVTFAAKRRRQLHDNIFIRPLLLYSAALLLSLPSSEHFVKSVSVLHTYFFGISLALAAMTFNRKERDITIQFLLGLAGIASLVSLFLWQSSPLLIMGYLTKHSVNDPFAVEYLSRQRAFLPFILPTALAGYAIFHLCIALGYYESIDKKRQPAQRTLVSAAITLMLLAALITKSFGPLLSIVAVLLAIFLVEKRREKKYVFWLSVLAILMVFIAINRTFFSSPVSSLPFSFERRFSYWADAISSIKKHPLFGIGLCNFSARYSHFAHNLLLQIWAETGILGIAGMLWIIFSVIKTASSKMPTPVLRGLFIAWLFFVLHNLTDITFFLPEIAAFWWVVTGLLAAGPEQQYCTSVSTPSSQKS